MKERPYHSSALILHGSDGFTLFLSLVCALCKIFLQSNNAAKLADLLGIGNLMRLEVSAGSNINEFTDE